MDSEFHYCQWQKADRATQAALTTTFKEYKELLIDSINNLTRPSYLTKAQAWCVKSKKEYLGVKEVMVHGEFAEKYEYLIQDKVQSFHWRKEYCTLHPLQRCWWHFRWQHGRHKFCLQDSDTTGGILEIWGSRTSQRSITFLMVVARNMKLLRTSLIYVPLKRTFPSKQSKFSLQLATGNHRVMKSVVRWNAILQNEVCRDHSTTKFWTIVRCWKYVKKKWNQLFSLALIKKTWSRWERIWRRDSKMVRRYPVQEAVIILFPSQHHKLDTNCAVRMTRLWRSMTSKFQLELILATLHLLHVQLVGVGQFGEESWWGASWCRYPIHTPPWTT